MLPLKGISGFLRREGIPVLPGLTAQPGLAGARAGWDAVQGRSPGAGAAACRSPLPDRAADYSTCTDPAVAAVTGRAAPTHSALPGEPSSAPIATLGRVPTDDRGPRGPATEMAVGRGKPQGRTVLGAKGARAAGPGARAGQKGVKQEGRSREPSGTQPAGGTPASPPSRAGGPAVPGLFARPVSW